MDNSKLLEELRKSVNRGAVKPAIIGIIGEDFRIPDGNYAISGESLFRTYRRRLGRAIPESFEYNEIQRLLNAIEEVGISNDFELFPVEKNGETKVIVLADSDTQTVVYWSEMWKF